MTILIIGEPASFAIESSITEVLVRESQLAIGYFVIHVAGRRFGVHASDATLLRCSFDAVERRISRRGSHCISFGAEPDAIKIADAVLAANYIDARQEECFFGLSCEQFRDVLVTSEIVWAPDGDEAFDDGGNVLQFDLGNKVRLIAFMNLDEHEDSLQTVVEKWIDADQFYQVLIKWKELFEVERNRLIAGL